MLAAAASEEDSPTASFTGIGVHQCLRWTILPGRGLEACA